MSLQPSTKKHSLCSHFGFCPTTLETKNMAHENTNTTQPEQMNALQDSYTRTLDSMRETSELMTKRLELIQAKEAHWNALERKLEENAAHAAERIKLDVGGKVFCISKTHLLSVQGSYFHAMLGSGHWKPDSDGAYFIDRSPEHFDRILEYLITGKLSFNGLRRDQMRTLEKTLDYLQLNDAYQPPVIWNPQTCGSGLQLSDENRVVKSTAKKQSVHSLYPCTKFSVRLDAGEEHPHVSIGFAPSSGFNGDSAMDIKCGWYIFARTGTLYSPRGDWGKTYATVMSLGSVVTCILDRDTNSISFQVDGQSFGVAYTAIPQTEMYATLSFDEAKIQVSLVN